MSDTMSGPTQPDTARVWLLAQARDWRAENAPDMTAVHAWRDRFQATIGPVPVLGSAAWVALPDTDPRKVAAAIGPAVARLTENTPAAIAMRLGRELLAVDRAVTERIKAASLDVCGAQDWSRAAYRPSWELLARRRGMALCFSCKTRFPWTAPSCPGCGWSGALDEIRARATTSWAAPPTRGARIRPDRSAA